MNKIVVIYESKYGSTKKYAQWISQELSCDVVERKSIQKNQLADYDTIIYGGGLYAGGINGIKFLSESYSNLKNKNFIFFACGIADKDDADYAKQIKEKAQKELASDSQRPINIFYLRGGINYAKLAFLHKLMMAMLHKVLARKDYASLTNEQKQMIDTYGKNVDFADEKNIEPIIAYVRGL